MYIGCTKSKIGLKIKNTGKNEGFAGAFLCMGGITLYAGRHFDVGVLVGYDRNQF